MLPSYPTPWSALFRVQQIDLAARRELLEVPGPKGSLTPEAAHDRAEAAAFVPATTLAYYEALRKGTSGPWLRVLSARYCPACGVPVGQRTMLDAFRAPVPCPHCGFLLLAEAAASPDIGQGDEG